MAEAFSPFRAPKSFGLSGLMCPEARILHEVIFDLHAVGRVSDLLSARLKRTIPDELELRAAILFAVVDAHRFILQDEPIRIECGVDNEKLGVSVVFTVPAEKGLQSAGLAERVASQKPGDRIEAMLASLLALGEQVVFRMQPSSGMAEVAVLSSLSRGALTAQPRLKGRFELVVLGSEPEEGVPVAEFTALGDVEYQKLLRPSRKAEVDDEPLKVSGEVPEDDLTEVRISGTTQNIKGDDSKIVLSGGGGAEDSDSSEIRISATSKVEEPEKKKGFFEGLASLIGIKSSKSTEVGKKRVIEVQALSSDGPADSSTAPVVMGEISGIANALETAAENGSFSKLVDRLEREKVTIMGDAKNPKVEKWIEGLASELVAERARIAEMAKRLSQQSRQKELEFKNKENTLMQDVRSKDEVLRTKTLQLMRLKDQVAKLQMSVERAKQGTSNAEESASKIKLAQTQRLVQSIRSENDQLSQKMQEMRLRVEQLTEQKRMMVPNALHSELERKYEKLQRQFDELRRGAPVNPGGDGGDSGAGGSKAA